MVDSHKVYNPIEKISPLFPGGGLAPAKFTPTYYEWLSNQGQQVIKSIAVSVASSIYVVPKGYTFFLTNCFIGLSQGGGAQIYTIGVHEGTTFLYCKGTTETFNSIAQSFSIPLRFQENVDIRINCGSLCITGVEGFIVPMNILKGI